MEATVAQHPATQLSLKLLRADERFTLVEVVEYWKKHPGMANGVRVDLFNIIDILCLGPGITMGVQTTSEAGFSARMKKLREHENTRPVLAAGWLLEVHGWAKVKNRWTLTKHKRFELESPPQEE